MLTALDVASYILYTAYKIGDSVTNLKLQKLLFYVQADYLVANKGLPLFSDPIEAWQYGPVVKSVYDKYKCFGRNPINDEALVKPKELTDEQKKQIDNTLENYMSCSAFELVRSIHNEEPWRKAYDEHSSNEISVDSMYKFYKKLKIKKDTLLAAIEE